MKNRDCPVCDPWLGKLAEEVPFSHHVNSTIVCRLSGKIMDEDNAPMAFPNGYVYSREVRPCTSCDLPSGISPPLFLRLESFLPFLLINSDNDQALEEMSAQNDGKVKCPRTQDECDFSKLKKVFIS
jgi:macrophage erythroblast attacher